MKKLILYIVILASVSVSGSAAATLVDSVTLAPFGKVYVYRQTPTPQNVAIMISGDGGWKSGVIDFSETFSKMNTLVIGVDIVRYYRNLRQRSDECYNVTADFVQLATEIEKKYNYSNYISPVLMGYSSGATLVYAILAQARPATFPGGISLGFCPDIDLPKMLCQYNGLIGKILVGGKSIILSPDTRLGNKWIVLQGKLDKICDHDKVAEFVKNSKGAELVSLPEVGHGFSKWSDFMPQWKDAYSRIIEQNTKAEQTALRTEDVEGLPLVITKALADDSNTPVALLISGDGGWYGFEQKIADNLAKAGVPTIGLDSKKYFWNRRTPEETARDIARAYNFYSREWKKEGFMLIGYSLGSELVPFIVNRLPEDVMQHVRSAVLLSPETNTDFEVHISNMIGMGNRQNTYNVIEEIRKMQGVSTLIIYGEGEKSKVPDLLKGVEVTIKLIPGDHHYKFDVPLILRTMKENNSF